MNNVAATNHLLSWGGEDTSVAAAPSLNHKSKKNKKNCKYCNKEFFVFPSKVKNNRGVFCSRKCFGKWRSENTKGENNPAWKGGKIKKNCNFCGKSFYIFPSTSINYSWGKFCSKKCMGEWKSKNETGQKNNNWKGGMKFWNKRHETSSFKYKNWHSKILKRDNYTCYLCKDKGRKGHPLYLEAHHIKSWKNYPKLRYTLYNGITLCRECHLSNRVEIKT